MSKTKDFTIKDLMNWCDAQVAEGKFLEIKWEGGGDSGWVYFEIDGEQTSEPEAEALVDMIYSQLDYGSWAGEFSASGSATYDPITKSFQGEDNYSEEEGKTFDCHITVKIPKHIPFDRVLIEAYESNKTSVNLTIANGFDHPERIVVQQILEEQLTKEFEAVLEQVEGSTDEEIASSYQWVTFERENLTEEGEYLVGVIEDYCYSVHVYDPRDVDICLEEMLEETNEED